MLISLIPQDHATKKHLISYTNNLPRTPSGNKEYIEAHRPWADIAEKEEREAWLAAVEYAIQLIDEGGYDVRQEFKDFEEFSDSILRPYQRYPHSFAYRFEKSFRDLPQAQEKKFHDHVAQLFGQHLEELEQGVRRLWDHGNSQNRS